MTTPPRGRLAAELDRHWIALTLVAWLAVSAWYVGHDWNMVRWLSLGDTDDNMRLMQVRAWLNGQGWYDLRNYRLDPPRGFDIHWSRIVDLPIAGLILFFRLFTSNAWAERLACGIAPLLPLSIAMLGVAATVRRLVHPLAWPLAIVFLLGTSATMLMFLPERIDHHGWQLAMLSLTVAGLCDPRALRGGITTVFIPEENEKDLVEIPANITSALKIIPVSHVDQVLAGALVAPVEPIEWTEADELAASPRIAPGGDAESAIRH